MSEHDSQARVHCSVGDVSVTVEANLIESATTAFEQVWQNRVEEARDPGLRSVYAQEPEQEEYGGYSVGDQ